MADIEAARIVALALGRLNARRPTWEEGQREYIVPRENCYRCQAPLDDEQIAKRHRFCSSVCASAHVEQRNYVGRIYTNKVATNAYRAVLQSKRPLVKCKECEKKFRPITPGGKWEYCSRSCSKKAMHRMHAAQLPAKQCPACGTMFKPKAKIAVFCSQNCGKNISAIRRALETGKPVQLKPMAFDYFVTPDIERRKLTPPTLDKLLEAA